MPTLFGSEYLLPAIIVVVLLLALLLLMSARRRAAGGAVPATRSRRRKKASVADAPAAEAGEEPVVAATSGDVWTEPVVSEPLVTEFAATELAASPVEAESPASTTPVPATAAGVEMTETVTLASPAPADGEADTVTATDADARDAEARETDALTADAADDPAQTPPSEQRRRSSRRRARITVRTQAAGSVADPSSAARSTTRFDPLQVALTNILGGWGDLSPEDTKRLELFRADRVVEAIAAIELPKAKSGDYARTRLTQLRQYAADLERRSRPLQMVGPDPQFMVPLSSAAAPAGESGPGSAGSVVIAPVVAASVVTTPVMGVGQGGGTVVPFAPVPSVGAPEPGGLVVAAARAATVLDFYGSSAETAVEETAVEESASADPEPYEPPVYYETPVSSEAEPPVDAATVAKLPHYDPDDPDTFWAEPQPVWEPASEPVDERSREEEVFISFDEAVPTAYREVEQQGEWTVEQPVDDLETSSETAAVLDIGSGTADSGGSLWDEPPADALSRLSVKVETAEQLLALPPEERIDMTAFLGPSELTATFRATEDPELKKAVIDTLEHIGSPASLTALGYCFDDPDGDIQLYALEAADRLLGVA